MAKIIDGLAISRDIKKEIAADVVSFYKSYGIYPRLSVLLVGSNPASQIYVRKKKEACEEVGIISHVIEMPGETYNPQRRIENQIRFLNDYKEAHGILVQLPLPAGVNVHRIFDLIDPKKDVDVFNPVNVGLLVQGRPRFSPCTPHAVQQMLYRSGIPIAGKHVVVISRSDIIGKPLFSMLIQDNDDFANATVTVCHDRTPSESLEKITRTADIVVIAVGQPGFLKKNMLSPGVTIIDVGINRVGKKIVGDVDSDCYEVAGAVSRVPGGVGPVTVSMLLANTLKAAILQQS